MTIRVVGVIGLLAAMLAPAPSAAELSGNAVPANTVAAAALSSFTRHACAIDLAGDVRCWGQNSHGSLGIGSTVSIGDGGGEMGDNLAVVDLGTGRTATQISTGYYHSCAILDGGDVKCWGRGAEGQLGYGDTADRGDGPGEMGDALPTVDLGTGRTAVAVATGNNHTCAILDNDDLKCWGVNGAGELGYGDTASRGDAGGEMGDNLAAVDLGTGRTATTVATGLSHTCAILDNDDLKCWGTNASGELGLGSAGNRGDAPSQMGDNLPAVDLGTGRTATAVALGFASSCAVLDNGDLKCWGLNVGGRLGLGDTTNRGLGASDMGDNLAAINLGTGRTATAVGPGNNHICAILDDATVKCWGEGNWGQLGYGNPTALGSSPTHMGDNLATVDLGTGRTALAIAVGDGHTCVTLDDGSIRCWGYNGSGTLGIGTTANMGDGGGEMGDSLPVADLGTGIIALGGPDPIDLQLGIMANWNVGGTPRACENDGTGTWSNCVSIPITDGSPDGTSTIEAGDWNGDGRNDVVIGNQNGTLNSCLRGADGSWTCTANGATGRHRGIGVGDFNGDGDLEFVGAIETMSNMDVCIGDGTGGFTCSRVAAPNGGRDIVVNDYDGDGDLDLAYAAWPGPSAICANDGSAAFTCTAIAGTGNNLGVDQGDIDEDGNIDLVFGGGGTTDELLCTGDGTGAFTCSTFNAGGYHSQAKIGDLNGDDNLDVVVGGDGVPGRSCLGDGTGTLTCSDLTGPPASTGSVELGHIDGDSILDALFGSVGGVPNQSCLGTGTGQFTCTDIDATSVHNTQGVLLFDGQASVDDDGDGVVNGSDNCPLVANPGQVDTDSDLTGDACDADDDNDGLTDVDETGTHGTNPLLADTDSDTLNDNDEINTHSTNPLLADTDSDTLSDGDEINTHGTNPLLADTDSDTLNDNDEINTHGTNPLLADTDSDTVDDQLDNCPVVANAGQLDTDSDLTGDACDADDDNDGLTDVDETGTHGTNPLLADTDSDTLNDNDEINTHGTNPLLADTDGDSYDDADEIANGSNPLTPPAPQTITFADPADTTFDVGSFAVNPTAGSSLAVTVSATGSCTTAGFTVNLTGAGDCTLTAQQGGDYNWQQAPDVVQTVTVAPGIQAITHGAIGSLAFGYAPVVLTTSATSGLPVTITTTGPCMVVGLTLTVLGAGDCDVSFAQAGNSDWAAASTVTTTVGIAKAAQTITVTPPVDVVFGAPAQTLAATATSALPIAMAVTGPCELSGTDVEATGAGICTVTYDQAGDGDWLAAPTETETFTVDEADQTITVGPIADRFFDQGPVTLTPTTPSELPIDIVATGACTNVGATVTPTGLGTCTVTFDQPGDNNWHAAPTETVTFAIGAGRQVISLEEPTQLVFGDEPFEVAPVASSGLPVVVNATGACANEETRITIVAAGICSIAVSQAGDDDFEPAPTLTVTAEVAKAPQTISLVGPSEARYADPSVTIETSATSGLAVELAADGVCEIEDGELTFTGVGQCEIVAGQDGDDNWVAAEPVSLVVEVDKSDAEITVVTDTVGFSDEPQPAGVATEPPDLDGLAVTYDGESDVPSTPGSYELVATLTNANYRADEVTATFTVLEPVAVPEDEVVEYRFLSVGVEEVTANGLPIPTGEATVLTITGIAPESIVTLSDESGDMVEVVDDSGVVVLTTDPAFDFTEATFLVEPPEGPVVLVTTEDVARFGDSEVVLGFGTEEGDQAEETTITVEGDGLAPRSGARVVVHSTPIEIGVLTADDQGAFSEVLTLPSDLEDGEHRVLVHTDTPDGTLTGTWFFAVDDVGTLERLGDPEPPVLPVAEVEPTETAPPAELAAVSDDEVAQEPITDLDPEPLDEDVEIDVATGLPVYDPVEDPVQTVESGVNGFTIVTVVTAAAGSVAAIGSMAPTGGGLSGSGGGMGGGATGGGARTGSSGRGGGDASSDESRSKGKIASGKAKGLGDGLESVAWGDNSTTWQWPMVFGLDRLSRELPDRLRVTSPLLSRVSADGSTLRALFGTGALIAPVLGAVLGLVAVIQTGGVAVAPSTGVVILLILLGIFDASAGLAAAAVFAVGVALAGGAGSADSIRTVMGVGSLWYAVPLIAGGARKFRRPPPETWEDRWQRLADIAIGSLLGAWAVQTVLKALPGLSGVALPISQQADRVALIALVALIGRYVLESVAIHAYPERMAVTAPIDEREPEILQQVLSVVCKAGVFVFVIEPYIGMVWQLGVVVALMVVPSGLGIIKDRFPNVAALNRVLPSGVPAILFFMVIGKTLGSTLGDRIEDPATLAMTTFVVLSIPGFVSSMAGLFGRDSQSVEPDWTGRIAGLSVVVVTYLMIRGHIDAAPLQWIPFAIAPAFLWWAAKSARTELEAPVEEEETDGDEPESKELVGAR